MEERYRKALNFDLDTKRLKKYYPKQNYKQAYYDLGRVLKENGYVHRQGSGYVSVEKLVSANVYDLIDKVNKQCPWLNKCVKRFDVTDVGKQYDLTAFIKMNADIAHDKNVRAQRKETKESVLGKLREKQKSINKEKENKSKEHNVKINERNIR